MKSTQFFFAILLFTTTQTLLQACDQTTPYVKWDGVEVETVVPKKESIIQINKYLRHNNLPVRIDAKGQIWVGLTHLTSIGLVLKIKNQTLTEKDIEKIRSIFTTTKSKL